MNVSMLGYDDLHLIIITISDYTSYSNAEKNSGCINEFDFSVLILL